MRMVRLVLASVVAIALGASMGSVFAAEDSKDAASTTPVAAPAQFATLKGVNTVPMAPSELNAVKGTHVHFLDAGGGKLHLAGDVKTQNNWKNLGGTDGVAVAPSYRGLCVAHASGGIFIPTRGAITTECP
jgi:hypothetical protein